jgi:hypothetical protein
MGPAEKFTESEDSYESDKFASTDASPSGDERPSIRRGAATGTVQSQRVAFSVANTQGNGRGRPLYITSLPGPFINLPGDELAKLERVSFIHFSFTEVALHGASINFDTVSCHPKRKASTQSAVFDSLVRFSSGCVLTC